MAVKKDPRTLELAEPFVSLFPVEPETLRLVTDSIREHGYQIDKPILAWRDAFGDKDRTVVVDGHTRLRAALDLSLREVWVTVRQFKTTDAAITAGIGEQVIRRNLNREQIAAYVVSILPLLDERRGGLRTRTTKQLAALLGVSTATVDRARGVLASGDEDLIDAVKNGTMSLLAAYTEVTTGAPPAPAVSRPRMGEEERAARLAVLEEQIGALVPVRDRGREDEPVAAEPKRRQTPREGVVLPEDIETPEQRLVNMHEVLDYIDLFTGDLRKVALGVTVTAHGHRGNFRIAQLQFHPSGAVYALDGAGKKKIDLRDVTKVVKLPEALNA